nr:uridine diphosphate glucose pyrophosphatase NUDT14 [Parasteatoda tepidariorum]
MEKIKNVRIVDCTDSFYMRPSRMEFEQDGKKRTWDLMRIHDRFAAVYFNSVKLEDCDDEISVTKYPPSLGITIELCAGIVDKDQSLVETARDEILEECGYLCPLTAIHKVSSYKSGVGVSGSTQTLYYAEVTDAMKVSEGGGNRHEGEYIEVVELTLPEAKSLIYDESVPRPATMVLALLWFFENQMKSKI